MEIANQFGSVCIYPDNNFHYTGWIDLDAFIEKFLDEDTVNWEETEGNLIFMAKEKSEEIYKILVNSINGT